MHISTLLLASGATLALAECFGSGDSWGGDRSAALAAAQTYCNDGTLNNAYGKSDTRYKCVNLSTIKKVDFTITSDSTVFPNRPINLTPQDCVDILSKEINGCEHGGHSSREFWADSHTFFVGNMEFTSDPNTGNCAP